MVYRKLGKSNWEVSILAFGGMLLPIKNGGQRSADRFADYKIIGP
jgi:predicted aldo/keto reductase-like oxidoreductase